MTRKLWEPRKEVNDLTGKTRWVVIIGGQRLGAINGDALVTTFRTRWGAKRKALKLNVSEGWKFVN